MNLRSRFAVVALWALVALPFTGSLLACGDDDESDDATGTGANTTGGGTDSDDATTGTGGDTEIDDTTTDTGTGTDTTSDTGTDTSPGTTGDDTATGDDETGDTTDTGAPDVTEVPGTRAAFAVFKEDPRRLKFYESPFPSDFRLRADGTVNYRGFPNPTKTALIDGFIDETANIKGFGNSIPTYITFNGGINETRLPSLGNSAAKKSVVFLINIDADSPYRGERIPVQYEFQKDATKYIDANTLVILPAYGFAPRAATTYATVVLRDLQDDKGAPLGSNVAFEKTKLDPPAGSTDELWAHARGLYKPLYETLQNDGIDAADVAIATVWTTQDSVGEMFKVAGFIRDIAPNEWTLGPIDNTFNRSDYLVAETTADLPQFQNGALPFNQLGTGLLTFDAQGKPVVQRYDNTRIGIGIPGGTMPEEGWPLIVYSHGTGGDHLSFLSSIGDGGGAAWIAFESIHHGTRAVNPATVSDTEIQLNTFNVKNPLAGRDNFRQTAIDILSTARLALATDQEIGGRRFKVNPNKVYFMGHSQGSVAGPAALAVEPLFKAAMYSGPGAALALALITKTEPLDIRAIVRVALSVTDAELNPFNPIITLVQTLEEAADGMNYGRFHIVERPEGAAGLHMLQTYSAEDSFSPPETNEAMAVALQLSPVAPVLVPFAATALLGQTELTRPAGLNLTDPKGNKTTGLLVQITTEGTNCSDGHFVSTCTSIGRADISHFFRTMIESGKPTIGLEGER